MIVDRKRGVLHMPLHANFRLDIHCVMGGQPGSRNLSPCICGMILIPDFERSGEGREDWMDVSDDRHPLILISGRASRSRRICHFLAICDRF